LIGRTFVDLPQEIEIKEIIDKLQGLKDNKFQSTKKEDYSITKVESGVLRDFFAVDKDSRDFVPVIISFDVSVEVKKPILNDTQTDIQLKKQMQTFPNEVYFWLFKDKIIFSNISKSRTYLIGILNKIMLFEINIPYYDINKLHKDYKNKKNIRGYGFNGRKDSAHSGSLYFPDGMDSTDKMVQETDNVGKSFVSLTGIFDDVDFTVYGSGAIVISKDWYNMAKYVKDIMQIKDFLKPYEKN
jgi:hypothetical protein